MFKVSSSSDSFSHRSTSSSRAFLVDVYSVTNSMSDAFSGLQPSQPSAPASAAPCAQRSSVRRC